jgi:hypothetical protein
MYGACRAVGIGPSIEFGGRRFIVHARRVRDYAVIEAAMLAYRGNPFDVVRWMLRNGWNQEWGEKLFKRIRNGWWNVNYREMASWLGTWEGRVLGLWVALRDKADYEFVRDSVLSHCDLEYRRDSWGPERWWTSIQEAMDAANGDDELSALDWISRKSEDGEAGIPWPLVFRILGEEPFNFAPVDVEQMTLAQIQHFWCERSTLQFGFTAFDADSPERVERVSRETETRERAVKSLAQGLHWGAR